MWKIYIYQSVQRRWRKKRTTHQRLTFTVRVQCFISRLTGEKANESKTEHIQWNENNGLSGSSSHCNYDVTLCIHAIHWKCVNYMLKSSDSNDTAATIDVPKDHQMFFFQFYSILITNWLEQNVGKCIPSLWMIIENNFIRSSSLRILNWQLNAGIYRNQ